MLTSKKAGVRKLLIHMLVIVMICTAFGTFQLANSDESLAYEKMGQITGSKLFVRKGAGTKYGNIGTVSKGTYKLIEGSKKDSKGTTWYKISKGSKKGYVSSKYVNIIKLSTTSLNNVKATVKIESGKLNARSGPGTLYKVVKQYKNGTAINLTGKVVSTGGSVWYKTNTGGSNIYIHSKYVKLGSTSTQPTTTKPTTQQSTTTPTTQPTQPSTGNPNTEFMVTKLTGKSGMANVSSGSLIVRKGPGTLYSSIGTLNKGYYFFVTGKTVVDGQTWYRIQYNTSTGYVSGSYVKLVATSQLESRSLKAREAAKKWAVKIANDNSFHYGKSKWAHHNGCYYCGTNTAKGSAKLADGGSKSEVEKTYCCNPFVTAAYCHGAGAKEVDCKVSSKRFGLANDSNKVLKNGAAFMRVVKPSSVNSLQVGDILLTPTHCMLYIGDGKIAHAAHHDNGKKDSYWNESISVGKISSYQWGRTSKIYRYIGTGKY